MCVGTGGDSIGSHTAGAAAGGGGRPTRSGAHTHTQAAVHESSFSFILQKEALPDPRPLFETRSTVLGALPGSDPGVDGDPGMGQNLDGSELEEFVEQPNLSLEMIQSLVRPVCC